MKLVYKKKHLLMLFKEYPFIYLCSMEKLNDFNFLINNDIKNIKFKNTLLKTFNKKFFNGIILLVYGNNLPIHKLKNIVGIFCNNHKFQQYFISFEKYLKIIKYLNFTLKYKPLYNLLKGRFFWLLLKF